MVRFVTAKVGVVGFFLFGLLGCSESPTQVVVQLEADETARMQAAVVMVRACTDYEAGPSDCAGEYREERPVSEGIPGRIPIGPPRDPNSSFWIEASLLGADRTPLVTARLRGPYAPGEVREVRLRLEDACRGVECPLAQTCQAGVCVDLCPEAGCAPAFDAGPPVGTTDAGRPDVGLPDAGRGCDCACESDRCVDGVCIPARPAQQVSAGQAHTIVVVDGYLLAWGDNTYSQLGQGADGEGARYASPIPIEIGRVVRDVSAGERSTCAVVDPGELWCWGANDLFRLGRPDEGRDRTLPNPTDTTRTWSSVSVHGAHACGETESGQLYCWGDGRLGQLGIDRAATLIPVFIQDLGGVAVGDNHSCALFDGSVLFCWGSNDSGQIAVSSEIPFVREPRLVGGGNVVSVAASGNRTCVIRHDGAVWCWGDNRRDQLGLPFSPDQVYAPERVGSEEEFARISLGGQHQCGVTQEGRLFCWGRNRDGQIGDGDTFDRVDPVEVRPSGGWQSVSAGRSHTCAIREGGSVYCWGQGELGQLTEGCGLGDVRSPCRVCLPVDG